MRYVEVDKRIYTVYSDFKEWKEAKYAQQKPLKYLEILKKIGDPSSSRAYAKGFRVGVWVEFHHIGVMQILAVKRISGTKVLFRTCLGWADLGDEKPVFNQNRFNPNPRAQKSQPDINFAASFALTGDLHRSFAENIDEYAEKNRTPSKKKSYPHFLMSYQTQRSVNRLRQ